MQLRATLTLFLLAISMLACADEQEVVIPQHWLAVFGELNRPDSDKIGGFSTLDDGNGAGFEYGYRWSEDWALRLEFSHLDFDGNNGFADDSGNRIGLDVLRYIDESKSWYGFGGIKHQNLRENFRFVNAGIGKHWWLNERWRLISEMAAYFDPGQDAFDFGIKLGLGYYFNTPKAAPALQPPAQRPQRPAATAAKDSDGDGVYDQLDACPGTPAGIAVDERGCPLDSDGDGVWDSEDRCPDTPKTDQVNAYGCSIFAEKQVSRRLEVLFANNSADIQNPNHPDILAFAAFLNRYEGTDAVIEGHTSAPGSADYNMQLSQRRATAIVDLLTSVHGISASRLKAVGYGETRLLDSSNSTEAHRVNRRIEAQVSATEKEKVQR